MNDIRKILNALLAMALLWSLPAFAAQPTKVYSITAAVQGTSTAQLPLPPVTTFLVVVTNTAPPNTNSSFNSIDLLLPANWRVGQSDITVNQTGVTGPTGSLDTSVTGHLRILNLSPVRPTESVTIMMTAQGCGDGVWSAAVWTGSNLTGTKFALMGSNPTTPVICDDILCNEDATPIPTNGGPASTDPYYVKLNRGLYNSNGGTINTDCAAVNYFATNTVPVDGIFHLRWNDQPHAAFLYTVNHGSPPKTSTGNPQVAWLLGTDGQPKFIASQACLPPGPGLPQPYATLTAFIDEVETKLKIDTSTPAGNLSFPATGNFDIVIGTERMTVTKVTTNTLTVLRHQANTDMASHDIGALVMYTPLPLLPNNVASPYTAGDPAQVCIQAGGTYPVPPNSPPGTLGQKFTTFIDIGDPWVRIGGY